MSCNHYNDTENLRRLLGRETAGSIIKWNYDIIIVCCQWKKESTITKRVFQSLFNWKSKINILQWLSTSGNERACSFILENWMNFRFCTIIWIANAEKLHLLLRICYKHLKWHDEFQNPLLNLIIKLINFYAINSAQKDNWSSYWCWGDFVYVAEVFCS